MEIKESDDQTGGSWVVSMMISLPRTVTHAAPQPVRSRVDNRSENGYILSVRA